MAGGSDYVACVRGRFVYLHFRSASPDTDKINRGILHSVERDGGLVFEVCPKSWPKIYLLLQELKGGQSNAIRDHERNDPESP